ncbi:MAG: hypothetical protein QM820_18400 [Minicystis sp.]
MAKRSFFQTRIAPLAALALFGATGFIACGGTGDGDESGGAQDQVEPVSESAEPVVGNVCGPVVLLGHLYYFTCDAGETCCGETLTTSGICRNLQTDVDNCGECGHVCGSCPFYIPHRVCGAGLCLCKP